MLIIRMLPFKVFPLRGIEVLYVDLSNIYLVVNNGE